MISTTTSSSAAFPGGEAFDFAFSPNGHWTLAFSSSRIYIIDTVSPKISVQRELKVLRRPVSAAILDDGSTLAVLYSDNHVNIYDLSNAKTKHLRSISLDNSPHAIALTPKGEVLAAAYESGVELHSLARNAGKSDRRTVKCDRIDCLMFSNDGTTLLGTTRNDKSPNTVILSAPYYIEDNQDLALSDQIGYIWTSQIIFPNSSRDCSHAALLPNRSDGDANWGFTFDRVFESFRAVRTDDLRNGTTYFTGPKRPKRTECKQSKNRLTPCTLPAPSQSGELVAAGFLSKDVWLYGVPEGLDTAQVLQTDDPTSSSGGSTPASAPRSPARSFTRGEATELTTLPKWQVLVDKYRNVFAKGRLVAEIPGVTALCWVDQRQQKPSSSLKERLVVAAPGGIAIDPEIEQDSFAALDGGRLLILDFDRGPGNGGLEELTFEVGDAVPELLEEESVDLDTEVEIARLRTVRKEARPVSTVVAALASSSSVPPLPPTADTIANFNAAGTTAAAPNEMLTSQAPLPQPGPPGLSLEEATEAFDGPYSHTHPRSRTSLYRSATAVAANRQRNPPRIVEEARVEYRLPGDRTELPHESDADNWIPPPPPYAPQAEIPLPEHLRRSIMPRLTEPPQRRRNDRNTPRRASTVHEGVNPHRINLSRVRANTLHRETRSDMTRSIRSVSESLDQLSGSVSPLSSNRFLLGDQVPEPSSISPNRSAASSRRPISACFDRLASNLRHKSRNPRLSTPPSPESMPPLPHRPGNMQSVSLPASPIRSQHRTSATPRNGANVQHQHEYPPAPVSSHALLGQTDEIPSIPAMPSPQQLANLSNRYGRATPAQPGRRLPQRLMTSGDRFPAPPPGALGAAGSLTASHLQAPAQILSHNTSFSRSSPALLRPTARRLDTIESVSSFVSQKNSRSRSRGLRSVGSATTRKSQSVGPALRLDRAPTNNGGMKKSWLTRREKRKEKDRPVASSEDALSPGEDEKGGKCRVM